MHSPAGRDLPASLRGPSVFYSHSSSRGWIDPWVGLVLVLVLDGFLALGGLIVLTWDFSSSFALCTWTHVLGLALLFLAGSLFGSVLTGHTIAVRGLPNR